VLQGVPHVPDHPTASRRRRANRPQRLGPHAPIQAAALNAYTQRGGRCHHGGPPHAGQHLTFTGAGDQTTVAGSASPGGRRRGAVEQEGFQRQKASGWNREQVRGSDPPKGTA
jgi:hypothetical protein